MCCIAHRDHHGLSRAEWGGAELELQGVLATRGMIGKVALLCKRNAAAATATKAAIAMRSERRKRKKADRSPPLFRGVNPLLP